MWAFSRKTQEGISKVTSRLVAQGFEDMERNFVRKDSTTFVRKSQVGSSIGKFAFVDVKFTFYKENRLKEKCS